VREAEGKTIWRPRKLKQRGREVASFVSPFPGVTQTSRSIPVKHPFEKPRAILIPIPIKSMRTHSIISPGARNLTPDGRLFPVGIMLAMLGFRKLVEESLTVLRIPRFMPVYEFLLAIVLSIYVGFFGLSHIPFVSQDPMLTGILKITQLPPQSTFWRFLASLHLAVALHALEVQRKMRQRVWAAANVRLTAVTLDTDTTAAHGVWPTDGVLKSYNPKNKGKKSFQPILTFIAEARGLCRANYAMATGRMGSRSRAVWKVPAPTSRPACRRSIRRSVPVSRVSDEYPEEPIDLLVWFYIGRAGPEN
jgi:hypothetical protein